MSSRVYELFTFRVLCGVHQMLCYLIIYSEALIFLVICRRWSECCGPCILCSSV